MKKKINLLFIISILATGCKKSADINLKITNKPDSVQLDKKNTILKEKENDTLILNQLIKSSSLELNKKYKITAELDHIENSLATIKIYVKDFGNQPLGWVNIDFINTKLFDITNDIDSPISLTFDNQVFQEYKKILHQQGKINGFIEKPLDIEKVKCYSDNNAKNYTFTDVCEYTKNTNKEFLYKKVLDKFETSDLLEKLPQKDTMYSTKLAIRIKYKLTRDTIFISQRFDGGETEYYIYNSGNNGIIKEIKMPD